MKKMMRRLTMGLVAVAGLVMTGCGGAEEPQAQESMGVDSPSEEATVSAAALSCVLFKGLDLNGQPVGYQKCGSSGQWAASTYPGYSHYQQPMVDGTLPMNGGWASYNNDLVRYTT
ncbi:hypothetical protein, partial [Archangium sp.]|uniref:hypothetical protein n=1 Tax=Archangium sp. TaxID=1872627 RepID=UPI00286C975A